MNCHTAGVLSTTSRTCWIWSLPVLLKTPASVLCHPEIRLRISKSSSPQPKPPTPMTRRPQSHTAEQPTAGSSPMVSAGWWTSFSAGTAESLSLLIPYPRAGHAALLNVVHWLERRRDREPLAGPNDVVATAGFAAAQGDDPPRPADPTLSCRPPTDRIEGGRP